MSSFSELFVLLRPLKPTVSLWDNNPEEEFLRTVNSHSDSLRNSWTC